MCTRQGCVKHSTGACLLCGRQAYCGATHALHDWHESHAARCTLDATTITDYSQLDVPIQELRSECIANIDSSPITAAAFALYALEKSAGQHAQYNRDDLADLLLLSKVLPSVADLHAKGDPTGRQSQPQPQPQQRQLALEMAGELMQAAAEAVADTPYDSAEQTTAVLDYLGNQCIDLALPEAGVAVYRRAARYMQRADGNDRRAAPIYGQLTKCFIMANKLDDAIASSRQAIDIMLRTQEETELPRIEALVNAGMLYSIKGEVSTRTHAASNHDAHSNCPRVYKLVCLSHTHVTWRFAGVSLLYR